MAVAQFSFAMLAAIATAGLYLFATTVALCASPATSSAAGQSAVWTVDPAGFEQNLPRTGRSLFDFLMLRKRGAESVYDVPYPFSALLRKIEARLKRDESGGSGLKRVLIPLGRSLQRSAAEPEFFPYPRVVVAAVAEPGEEPGQAGPLLKDRLYLGFQEKSATLEVISYNEAAGRFEFQVVRNYARGVRPQVSYANRAMCTSCHQNSAPIFPRQLWDETNANPAIASLLAAERRDFYGYPPQRGVDIPYAIDNATDRANLFAATQMLWREGCDAASVSAAMRCRARLVAAALQFRLSGGLGFDEQAHAFQRDVVVLFADNARKKWPDGLNIPNPDIPNRSVTPAEGANVAAAFDPLNPRAALETWPTKEAGALVRRAVAGLAEFFAEQDVRRLDAQLVREAKQRKPRRLSYESACDISRKVVKGRMLRIDFDCGRPAVNADRQAAMRGRLYVEAGKITEGSIDRLTLSDGAELHRTMNDLLIHPNNAALASGGRADLRVTQADRRARWPDGNAIERMLLVWPAAPVPDVSKSNERKGPQTGRALITMSNDFDVVQEALEAISGPLEKHSDVLSSLPFRRASILAALFARIGMQDLNWCCESDIGMPAPVVEGSTQTASRDPAVVQALTPFYRYCSTCHQSIDRSPPNFLQGTAGQVAANIEHCAQRLYVRLSMWDASAEVRVKTPMPPIYALYRLHTTPEAWRSGADLIALRTYVESILQKQQGSLPRNDDLLRGGYEKLRPCLPPSSKG